MNTQKSRITHKRLAGKSIIMSRKRKHPKYNFVLKWTDSNWNSWKHLIMIIGLPAGFNLMLLALNIKTFKYFLLLIYQYEWNHVHKKKQINYLLGTTWIVHCYTIFFIKMHNGSCNTSTLQMSFGDFTLSTQMCWGRLRHHVSHFSFSPLRARLRTKCQVTASCSITQPHFCSRGRQKKSPVNKQKGQTQMFHWKTDDTKSLAEYSTSGICLLVTTRRSIFQQKNITSIALTVQHRCRTWQRVEK